MQAQQPYFDSGQLLRLFRPTLMGVLTGLIFPAVPIAAQEDRTLIPSAALTLDYTRNASGGQETRGGWLANLDLGLELNGGAIGWSGGSAFLYMLGNTGAAPSEWVGDLQVTNNIEAPEAFRVFEAWVQQELMEGRISMLLGLRDLNAEFYGMNGGEIFLNSSNGIGVEMSQSGENGPSIFPNSSLTFRVAAQLSDGLQLRAAVLDAVSNDPDRPEVTTINLSSEEGALVVGEIEVGDTSDEALWRAVLGGWIYTEGVSSPRVDILPGEAAVLERGRGLHLIAERRIGTFGQGGRIDAFARYGRANRDAYLVGTGWGGGVVATGIFGRESDRLGLALAIASGTDQMNADFTETVIEGTYSLVLGDYLEFRWDAQWVDIPAFLNPRGSDWVLSQRVVIGF